MSNTDIHISPLHFPWQAQDPFLFCAYHNDHFPAGNAAHSPEPSLLRGRAIGHDFSGKDGWSMYHGSKVPGFPYHPHRGFETVTVVQKGFIDHSDSMGASGRFSGGDVQWMTAGKGILHSEMFPLLKREEDNPLELFQIWLNLPKRSKMVEPYFKMFWREDIPVVEHKDSDGATSRIRLIAGNLEGKVALSPPPDSWAAKDDNGVRIFLISMEPHAQWTLPESPEGSNRSLAFYEGDSLSLNGQEMKGMSEARILGSGAVVLKNGPSPASVLVLEGKPLREPVVAHGPFVMNSKAEILEAFEEYRRTQFGGWPWPEQEQVHDPQRPRFALHADGREELPGEQLN